MQRVKNRTVSGGEATHAKCLTCHRRSPCPGAGCQGRGKGLLLKGRMASTSMRRNAGPRFSSWEESKDWSFRARPDLTWKWTFWSANEKQQYLLPLRARTKWTVMNEGLRRFSPISNQLRFGQKLSDFDGAQHCRIEVWLRKTTVISSTFLWWKGDQNKTKITERRSHHH